jgi:hypothetical protein
MKCNKVIYIQTFDNGKRVCLGTLEPRTRRAGTITQEICIGDIEVSIMAQDEPYFGGSSARLEVQWNCNNCGCTYHPERELPTEYNISEWVNSLIKALP